MRFGLLDNPSASPNSVMLNISRSAPTELRYVDFVDGGGSGTFNVTTLFGSVITFANSNGNFAGETFDNDPFNLVDWTVDTTGIVDFFATDGLATVTLDWETFVEVDSQDFVMHRATNFGGPFSNIGELPSAGPSSYQIIDSAVTPGQFYVYQLYERLTNNDLRFIAQRTATPWSSALPGNVLDVGASGTYATIDAALASVATPNPIVLVEPGTYPPFTVTSGFLGTLRIYADGTGPVIIDTTTGAVQFNGLGTSDKVDVSGLTIGSAGTSNAGVEVNGCAGLVILDDCIITGGSGQPGVAVDNSDRVAMTRCDTLGTPGILLFNGSTVIAGNGTLDDVDVQDTSFLRTAGMAYSSTVGGSATLLDYGAGPHANIDVDHFIPLNTTFTMTFSGIPNSFWGIFLSFDIGWADLYSSGILVHEMVPMADLGLGNLLAVLPFGPGGSIPINGALPPDSAILGLPIVVTMLNQDPGSGGIRWSNVVTLIGMPQ
jgi:hypothetical protein